MRLALALLLTATLHGQWDIQPSHTTASLRGIHSIGNGVAWASGTEGTVLRTTDDGLSWQRCPTPPAAEHLDFRGIQAFDDKTAIVMSSGKGDLSRLYKTTDACQSWKLVFTNPDKDGFWDAIKFPNQKIGFILGDPITRSFNYSKRHDKKFTGFALLYTEDGGQHFYIEHRLAIKPIQLHRELLPQAIVRCLLDGREFGLAQVAKQARRYI